VDMVLLEGGFLFVGLHVGDGDGLIKVWNTATGAEQSLAGPKVGFLGCVYIHIYIHVICGVHLYGTHGATTFAGPWPSMVLLSVPACFLGTHSCCMKLCVRMQGHILSLLAVNGMLFSGSNDSCIHVWKYDPATSVFNPAVCVLYDCQHHYVCGCILSLLCCCTFDVAWINS
jgi:hypothetical protein